MNQSRSGGEKKCLILKELDLTTDFTDLLKLETGFSCLFGTCFECYFCLQTVKTTFPFECKE